MIGSVVYAYGWQQVNPKSSCWLMQDKCLCVWRKMWRKASREEGGGDEEPVKK